MTIDIEQFRAELRADARRLALLLASGFVAAFASGAGLAVLVFHLAGRL